MTPPTPTPHASASDRTVLPYRSPRLTPRAWPRRTALVLCVIGFLFATFAWIAQSGIYYRDIHGPHVALDLPYLSLQLVSGPEGLHFRAWRNEPSYWPRIWFPDSIGMRQYHHGFYVDALGFVLALSPHLYNGGDYLVSPYAAMVLPYWLLIMGLGWLSLKWSGLWALLAPYRRWSPASRIAAAVLTAGFLWLNFIPQDLWTPGRRIWPETIWEWLALTASPPGSYSDICLSYGFPFTCLRQGYLNGKAVALYYGAESGWHTIKAAENVCTLLLAIGLTNLLIGAARARRARNHAPPSPQAEGPQT